METEERFHLQLTIQKLEEELTLYRNGTRAQHFLDIIAEKDAEINLLTSTAVERNSKLKQLARSSTELITKYNAIIIEKEGSLAHNNTLSTTIEAKEEKLKEINDTLMERDYIISTLSESNKEFLQQIESLESNVKSLDEDVQNLQNRCAQLVNEKAEKTRLLEKEKIEKTKQISEYRIELEKAMKFNMEIKTKLITEHKNALDIASRLRNMQQLASDNNKKALILEAEKEKYKARAHTMHTKYLIETQQSEENIQKLQVSLTATTKAKTDMQEAYNRELNMKSNKIIELEAQIKTLQLQAWIPSKSSAQQVSTNDKENTRNHIVISTSVEPTKKTSIGTTTTATTATTAPIVNNKSKSSKAINALKPQITTVYAPSSHYSSVPSSVWVNTNDFPV